jgi:acetoin utilization protein AcuB
MKVKYWMSPDPLTVTSDTLALEAQKIMKENRIRRLPVVDKGKLVGMVTFRNLIEAAPSSATSLSIHEMNYLILKMKVKDLMRKDPLTVSPEDSILDVLLLGQEKGIGGFPVVDKGKLVGIVTETEIFRAMIQLMGRKKESTILVLENVDLSPGIFGQIVKTVERPGTNILAMFSMPRRSTDLKRMYIRLKSDQLGAIMEDLKKAGYEFGE